MYEQQFGFGGDWPLAIRFLPASLVVSLTCNRGDKLRKWLLVRDKGKATVE